MSNFGSDYADSYDSMYEGKDYQGECDQIEWCFGEFSPGPITSVLDVGCGTGKHSWELVDRGFHVTGVDQSFDMLAIARNPSRNQKTRRRPLFEQGDATEFDLKVDFDAVIMMFAVISYLNNNESLIAGLKNMARHLKPGGLFLADFWYGPGVLMDNPKQRAHKRSLGEKTVERRVTPTLNLSTNTCLLNYEIITIDGDQDPHITKEDHLMRYFFGPELELALAASGLELLHLGQSSNWSLNLNAADWTGSLVARRA